MAKTDVIQLVRAAIDRNKEIPAVLDAYSEFVDSPIGLQELQNLGDVFMSILDNLIQRFPEAASRRAAKVAQTDVLSFLSGVGNDADRVRTVMRAELVSVSRSMANSIAERFRKLNSEERQAIDATLRIVKGSAVELLFRAEKGKPLGYNDQEFKRYFALVKSQAPGIRELRYQNLVIEKAIYNKLILKSKGEEFSIWVPSFFVKETVDSLIERNGVSSEHMLLSKLKEIDSHGAAASLESFMNKLIENLGITNEGIPQELSTFFKKVDGYDILSPIDLDDAIAYFAEKGAAQEEERRKQEEKEKTAAEAEQQELDRKALLLKEKMQPRELNVPKSSQQEGENAVFLGRSLDFNQLISAVNRRIPEDQMSSQVKQLGEYFLDLGNMADISIIGASGSGKSNTLNRILAGIVKKKQSNIVIIDPKGEHRGLAWKFKWQVLALVKDSQANTLNFSLPTDSDEDRRLLSDLVQEWLTQNGYSCSDVLKERIYSVLSSHVNEKLSLPSIVDLLVSDPDLGQVGQRLKKNLVQKGTLAKIFSFQDSSKSFLGGSILFDLSGRGLKDPTSKEERLFLATLLIWNFITLDIRDSIIIVEDVLDKFKVESLRLKMIDMFQRLRSRGNRFIITSRSECRDFLGEENIELVHRLSGEKTIADELSDYDTNVPIEVLARILSFMPRGYVITSRLAGRQSEVVAMDRLDFNDA